MYQVSVVFTLTSQDKLDPTGFQKWIGKGAVTVTTVKDGNVSFVAASVSDVATKLQYLIEDMESIKSMTINRI